MQNIDPPEPKPEEIYPRCFICDGWGWIADDDLDDCPNCENCDGKGYIEPEDENEIPY